MPRRKGHGILPTKRVKQLDNTRSTPLRNKLCSEIPLVNVKEDQMTVMAPINSDPPSIIKDALHSKYLHKKFKKMASTLLSEEQQQVQRSGLVNGSRFKNGRRWLDLESDREITSLAGCTNSQKSDNSLSNNNSPVISPPAVGGYLCPYCQVVCSKPSVLQKHIRAHTNERPYPCLPCGFAFKTKSNLYKHCRSRAHTFKLEKKCEKSTVLLMHGDESLTSEDESLSNTTNSAPSNSRLVDHLENREAPKSIYKPKYRFMEQSLKYHSIKESDERMEKCHSTSSLLLKIPLSNTNPSVSNQSSFTLGSSPSPEFLQHHISKLISENQAIVETNDPFWSKKLLNRSNSNENNSPISPVSTSPSPTDIGSPKDVWHSVGNDTIDNICDKPTEKHSKLVLALLRPQFSSTSTKFPVMDSSDVKPLNLTTHDKEQSDVQLNRKRSYSRGIEERSLKVLKGKINSTLSETSASGDKTCENKEFEDITGNSEGSIIKDLLLKGKEIAPVVTEVHSEDSPDSKFPTSNTSESSAESKSIKLICPGSENSKEFKNFEKLEISSPYCYKDSKTSLKSPTGCPSRSECNIYYKNRANEEKLLITSSTSSPGPLLGSTPLVEFHKITKSLGIDLNKKISKETRIGASVENKILTTTTLQSLEELSKCPMRSNLQMFGGELKIIDGPVEDKKTLELSTSDSLKISPESSLNLTLKKGLGIVKEDNNLKNSDIFVKIAKQSLHSGGSIIQTKLSNKQTSQPTSLPENGTAVSSALQYRENKFIIPIISKVVTSLPFVPYTSKITDKSEINPLTNLTAYNPLILPASLIPPKSPEENSNVHSVGVSTIVLGGKEIPYVPGMPGPHTLLPINSKPIFVCDTKFAKVTEKKTIGQQDHLSRIAKTEQMLSIHNKSTSLIPSIQLNNETKNSPVDHGSSTLRSHDQSQQPCTSPKTSVSKRSQMIVSPMETLEKGTEFVSEKKFLRPSSLPLKPGTFVPKKQSMGTPVLSLISPETPRPRKSYGQLYLNGHAYTYLGLKCSTRMFFCTLNKPQPLYIPLSPEHNKVSMYSNWKICTEADPNPCGLNPGHAMALYDSRHRSSTYTLACSYADEVITHSSYWTNRQQCSSTQSEKEDLSENVPKRVKIFAGGFESDEDYIYIRGRGRGRYMCEECGIRCKKPSMLKKHIRTHTDVRPFTCTHCKFSFKTKGNLTKHMKSKAHYKKCINLNISPVPTVIDNNSSMDEEDFNRQQALSEGIDPEEAEEEDDDEEEDTEDEEDEEDEECLEREAVQSLLTLSGSLQSATQRAHVTAGLVAARARPNTYPYSFTQPAESNEMSHTLTFKSTHREKEKLFQNTGVIRDVEDDINMHDSLEEADDVEGPSFLDSGSDPPLKCKQTTPMDLTNKPPVSEKNARVCEAAMLLASLCSTMERLPASSSTAMVHEEDSTLLQAYLTERAMQDSRMKQHQYKHKPAKIELLDHELKKTPPSKINISAAKENALGILAQTFSDARKLSASDLSPGSTNKPQAEFLPPSSGPSPTYVSILEDGRSVCNICNKVFSKPSQLRLHVNIHYFERPFRCESCAVSFRTKGHLQKHQRSVSHFNKVSMNSTFGTATTTNPRPFKCDDCKIAFRIHGHLAKHLRSKMHIMKLECLGKLPFGTYAELERSGINMNDIDTTDCENSLESLQLLAQKLYEKDPSKLGQWDPAEMMPQHTLSSGDSSSEGESEDIPIPLSLPTKKADCSGLSPMQRIPPLAVQQTKLNATSQSVSEPGRFKGPKHKPERADNITQSLRTELMCDGQTEPH